MSICLLLAKLFRVKHHRHVSFGEVASVLVRTEPVKIKDLVLIVCYGWSYIINHCVGIHWPYIYIYTYISNLLGALQHSSIGASSEHVNSIILGMRPWGNLVDVLRAMLSYHFAV